MKNNRKSCFTASGLVILGYEESVDGFKLYVRRGFKLP